MGSLSMVLLEMNSQNVNKVHNMMIHISIFFEFLYIFFTQLLPPIRNQRNLQCSKYLTFLADNLQSKTGLHN